jgi:hypothetical protein
MPDRLRTPNHDPSTPRALNPRHPAAATLEDFGTNLPAVPSTALTPLLGPRWKPSPARIQRQTPQHKRLPHAQRDGHDTPSSTSHTPACGPSPPGATYNSADNLHTAFPDMQHQAQLAFWQNNAVASPRLPQQVRHGPDLPMPGLAEPVVVFWVRGGRFVGTGVAWTCWCRCGQGACVGAGWGRGVSALEG